MAVDVCGVTIDMLVDTGSSVTLIDKTVFHEIECSARPTLLQSNSTLKAVNGEPLDVCGEMDIALGIQGRLYTQETIVADMGGLQGVLGLDFMLNQNGVLDLTKDIIRLNGVAVFMRRGDLRSCAHVCASEDVIIGPRQEAIVWANAERGASLFPSQTGMVEPRCYEGLGDLIIGRALIDTSAAGFPLPVLNVGGEDICIKAGRHVAVVVPAELLDSDPPTDNLAQVTGEADITAGVLEGAASTLPPHLQPILDSLPQEVTADQRAEVVRLLWEFQDVFMGPDGKLGRTSLVEHTIDTGDARPIKQPPRRVPIAMRGVVDEEINKMLESDVIRPSSSPWSSPIVLVRKKDGSVRFCVDYRRLNDKTRKDSYPLPNISEILDSLSGASWFSVVDCHSGFWQCAMAEDDRSKTAFATHGGLYEFNVMPFGLANAPATFQRLMELVLQGVPWEKRFIFLDDLLAPGNSFSVAVENLKLMLTRLQRANLKLKPTKCQLFQRSVKYLGHIVSGDGVRCDPDKVSAVWDWPTPICVTDIRSFVGLASYYRRFIPNFSSVAAPLHKLTEKGRKFLWDNECAVAFQSLKDSLTSAPVLSYPNSTDPFILDVDASGFATGAVLSQVQNSKEKVICYDSKSLNKTQRVCETLIVRHTGSYWQLSSL